MVRTAVPAAATAGRAGRRDKAEGMDAGAGLRENQSGRCCQPELGPDAPAAMALLSEAVLGARGLLRARDVGGGGRLRARQEQDREADGGETTGLLLGCGAGAIKEDRARLRRRAAVPAGGGQGRIRGTARSEAFGLYGAGESGCT